MYINVIPSFKCNQNCVYCYQRPLVNDTNILDVNVLYNRLQSIQTKYSIDDISIYGGEISLLDLNYLNDLANVVTTFTTNVDIITNLYDTKIVDYAHNHNFTIAISLNRIRPDFKSTISKLALLDKAILNDIRVNIVVLPYMIKSFKRNGQAYIKTIFDLLTQLSIKHVYFIQYWPSIYNPMYTKLTNQDYCDFMYGVYLYSQSANIITTVKNFNNAAINTVDSCLFILPNSNFASVYYTTDNLEYYRQFTNINQLITIKAEEAIKHQSCMQCEYLNNGCMAEHLRKWTNDECPGCKTLICKLY